MIIEFMLEDIAKENKKLIPQLLKPLEQTDRAKQ